ncbi:hypothetical protein GCM10023322_65810 [Rugosimonospora acidiphila]|uniref:NodB homology domain-containing protein n=1 Tax=Rugosimonospora acidiphila TaxID=556531 RepID=A0ABP9SHQ9_9ACTN
MRRDEAATVEPQDPAASETPSEHGRRGAVEAPGELGRRAAVEAPGELGRRGALKAVALVLAAVPAVACQPAGHAGVTNAAGPDTTAAPRRRAPRTTASPAGTGPTPRPTTTPEPSGRPAPPPGGASPGALSPGALPPEVTNGPRDRPNVALTFHGQGEPAQVTALLDELERGGARVTVLAVGSWLADQPQLAKRILDGGHELGNHTQNHEDLASMSASDAFAEINACAAVLRRLTGSIGTWFRPSMTQYSTATIRAQATRVGYATCLSYDLDSLDSTDPPAPTIVGAVSDSVRQGSIVSMHCGHAGTVTAIPAILDRLHGLGLRPVTMTELMSA